MNWIVWFKRLNGTQITSNKKTVLMVRISHVFSYFSKSNGQVI